MKRVNKLYKKIRKKLVLDRGKLREAINGEKFALYPFTLFAHATMRTDFDWDGNLTEFVNECVEYFFAEGLGVRIYYDGEKIMVEE